MSSVAEERVRLDTGLKALVRDVRREVAKLEQTAVADHAEMLDRATTEAQMILRQARLHQRSTAEEVDRMIEAAAAEAASLRKQALADAAQVAARVRGVVDVSQAREVDDLPLRDWRRPTPADEAPAGTPSATAATAEALTDNVVEHRPPTKRRGGRLAS